MNDEIECSWTFEDARQRFGAVMTRALNYGPQRLSDSDGRNVIVVNTDFYAELEAQRQLQSQLETDSANLNLSLTNS